MDLNNVAPDRREVLEKIALYERQRRFDEDVENDPPAPVLLPDRVDYLNKKLKSRIATGISNFIADHYFTRLIKKDVLIIDGVEGKENIAALKGGAMITCNHFSSMILGKSMRSPGTARRRGALTEIRRLWLSVKKRSRHRRKLHQQSQGICLTVNM